MVYDFVYVYAWKKIHDEHFSQLHSYELSTMNNELFSYELSPMNNELFSYEQWTMNFTSTPPQLWTLLSILLSGINQITAIDTYNASAIQVNTKLIAIPTIQSNTDKIPL